jgi:hydrogenase maturation protease
MYLKGSITQRQIRKMIKNKILILGIGNYLMADEGLGVHLAERIQKMELPSGVDVLDGGTGGFHLLEYFEQYERVIIIDATLDELPAGTVRLIKPRFAADFPQAMSTHDIGLKDLVGALQLLGTMPDIDLYVISIKSIQEQGIELSPEISMAIDNLIEILKERIAQLDLVFV